MNEPTITPQRLSEISGLLVSEAEADRAQVPGIAQELYDEVLVLRLRIASQEEHIRAQDSLINQ
jgi:hypothetical protein